MKKDIILTTMQESYLDFEVFKKLYNVETEYADYSAEEIQSIFEDQFTNDYETERSLLDIVTNDIIAIADLGFWNGRRLGYKDIPGNINNCLDSFDTDDYEIYVDGRHNLRGTYHHHDGTHYILFREFKDGMSTAQKEHFKNKIYYGTLTKQDISRYTNSLGKRIAACR